MKILFTIFYSFLVMIPSFGQEKELGKNNLIMQSHVNSDNPQEMKINVDTELKGDILKIFISKNGEEKEIEVPLSEDSLDNIPKLTKVIVKKILGDEDEHEICIGSKKNEKYSPRKEKCIKMGSMPYGFSYSRHQTWLGVHIQSLTDQLREYFKVRGDTGILVTEVEEDSPAESAGIKAGDVIYMVDDESIESGNDLVKYIRKKDAGDEVKIKLIRNGRKRNLKATLASRELDEFPPYLWFDKGEDGNLPNFKKFNRHFFLEYEDDLREELEELREEVEKLKEKLKEIEGL